MSPTRLLPTWILIAAMAALAACQRPTAAPARPTKPELVDAPAAGAVEPIVRQSIADARRDGRRLLVYVSATWCEPCERFQAALRAGQLDGYLPGLRLLKFDQDRDRDRLAQAGYAGAFIPRFVVPDDHGRGTDRRTEGGTKAADTVFTSIGPRLQQLLGLRTEPSPASASR